MSDVFTTCTSLSCPTHLLSVSLTQGLKGHVRIQALILEPTLPVSHRSTQVAHHVARASNILACEAEGCAGGSRPEITGYATVDASGVHKRISRPEEYITSLVHDWWEIKAN